MTEKKSFLVAIGNFYDDFFKSTANSITLLADIQRDYEEYKIIQEFKHDPEVIEQYIEGLDAAQQGILLKLLIRAGLFGKRLANLLNLTEQEKRTLATDLITFATKLKVDLEKANLKIEKKEK